jgi:transposase
MLRMRTTQQRVREVGDHDITVDLDLPGVRVVRQQQVGAELEVVVEPTTDCAPCPVCGRAVAKVHDRRIRRKQDEPLGERRVVIGVVRRRFRCPWDDRVFTESEAAVGGWRRRTTYRLRARLGQEGSQQPVEHVARRYAVSPTTVERAVQDRADALGVRPRVRPVRCLGLDDFSLRKGQRYATGVHDLTTGRVLDVIEGRTATVVQAALEGLVEPDMVAVVSMDMARAYRAAVQMVCPHAQITIDKFHVIKRVQEAVKAVWRQVGQGKERDDPVRRDGRLVVRNREDLTMAEWARLQPLLWAYPTLRQAWGLKEDFRRWYRTATATTARLELRAWERHVAATAIPALTALAGMFREWREEILSYFTTRVTNGPVEARNLTAKRIQRRGCGYRNLVNYKVRLLLIRAPSP